MKNINDLCGKDLDAFGKDNGVERYRGFLQDETDEEYRLSIRKTIWTSSEDGFVEIVGNPNCYCVFRSIDGAKAQCIDAFLNRDDACIFIAEEPLCDEYSYVIKECKVGFKVIDGVFSNDGT